MAGTGRYRYIVPALNYGYPTKSLFQRPGQTQRPTTIKIGRHLPEGFPHGNIFENFENFNFPPKITVFREFGLRKITVTQQKVRQRPRQIRRPTTIKIGMHLPEGLSHGHTFENIENSNFFLPKIAVFCEFGLRKITVTQQKVWYNAHANSDGIPR